MGRLAIQVKIKCLSCNKYRKVNGMQLKSKICPKCKVEIMENPREVHFIVAKYKAEPADLEMEN